MVSYGDWYKKLIEHIDINFSFAEVSFLCYKGILTVNGYPR